MFFSIQNVYGCVYLIDDETKIYLDYFEGCEEDLYSIFKINVKNVNTEEVHDAYVYLLDDFKESLVDENTYFLDNYTSKNEFYGEYNKEDDSSDNFFNFVKQLKNNKI